MANIFNNWRVGVASASRQSRVYYELALSLPMGEGKCHLKLWLIYSNLQHTLQYLLYCKLYLHSINFYLIYFINSNHGQRRGITKKQIPESN